MVASFRGEKLAVDKFHRFHRFDFYSKACDYIRLDSITIFIWLDSILIILDIHQVHGKFSQGKKSLK